MPPPSLWAFVISVILRQDEKQRPRSFGIQTRQQTHYLPHHSSRTKPVGFAGPRCTAPSLGVYQSFRRLLCSRSAHVCSPLPPYVELSRSHELSERGKNPFLAEPNPAGKRRAVKRSRERRKQSLDYILPIVLDQPTFSSRYPGLNFIHCRMSTSVSSTGRDPSAPEAPEAHTEGPADLSQKNSSHPTPRFSSFFVSPGGYAAFFPLLYRAGTTTNDPCP